ncbi:hypothetical protein CI238_13652, partial [Colletotrichum incanum]
LHGLRQRRL